jgi:hypothetical protein
MTQKLIDCGLTVADRSRPPTAEEQVVQETLLKKAWEGQPGKRGLRPPDFPTVAFKNRREIHFKISAFEGSEKAISLSRSQITIAR